MHASVKWAVLYSVPSTRSMPSIQAELAMTKLWMPWIKARDNARNRNRQKPDTTVHPQDSSPLCRSHITDKRTGSNRPSGK